MYRTDVNFDDLILEEKANQTGGEAISLTTRVSDSNNYYLFVFVAGSSTYSIGDIYKKVSGSYSSLGAGVESSSISSGEWIILRAISSGSSHKEILLDLNYNIDVQISASDSTFTSGGIGIRSCTNGAEGYIDWMRVRKYTSPEPTYRVGPEIWL